MYPVMLNLQGKKVLFIGGGLETASKVQKLLEQGAWVRLVSPLYHPELAQALHQGLLEWQQRSYTYGDLAGFTLCFSHPVDPSLNSIIAQEAKERGVWLNAVDDPAHCDFILPSVHRQGDLVLAVSTSGVAPALAVRIRERLAAEYGPEYAEYLELLRSFRPLVKQAYPHSFEARKAAWYRMIDSEALDLVFLGERERARAVLLQSLCSPTSPSPDGHAAPWQEVV
ncbi:MAG: bifunctional precorrin-2 dehydrogenase/sirohydrochlorin ferrochelatase [Meiothermus ruber]|nr:bifunctional precorrin-2 dehydrogenase/sirohydrochlorin ferrochelatase [Meiothermus ruber]